jgi:lysophospholipase L1-like esterase
LLRWWLPQPLSLGHLDASGLRVHVPNATVRYRTSEFDERIDINSHGLRGPEFAEQKPPGTLRILALGDSFVEGAQVALEETFVSRITRALAPRLAPRRVEVINAGVSRYGTADEIELFTRRGRAWSPDLVLLCFFTGNDVADNLSSSLFRWRGGRLVERPPLPPSRAQLWLASLKELATSHSHFVEMLRDRQNEIVLRWSLRGVPTISGGSDRIAEADWRLTAGLLDELQTRVEKTGARLWLVVIPSRERVLDTKPTRTEADVHERLLRFAKQRSVPAIDLLPVLRQTATGGSPYFTIDAHWNARGHEAAARAIVDALTVDGLS